MNDDYYDYDNDIDFDEDELDMAIKGNEPLTKARIQELFGLYDKNYFGAKAGAACILSDNGTKGYHWIPNIGCHGSFRSLSTEDRRAVYSSLWCRYEELYEAAIDYWGYLLDEETSPFKLALDGVEIIRNNDGRPIAVGFHDMDAPTRLVVGCMIQCRVPQENSNKLRSYWWWRKAGFIPSEALYLSELMYLHVDGTLSIIGDTYHHAFLAGKPINIKRIHNGDPNLLGTQPKSFNYPDGYGKPVSYVVPIAKIGVSNGYAPLTSMWEEGGVSSATVLDEIKGKPKYTGFFSKAFVAMTGNEHHQTGLLSKEDVAKTLKDNRHHWNMGVA